MMSLSCARSVARFVSICSLTAPHFRCRSFGSVSALLATMMSGRPAMSDGRQMGVGWMPDACFEDHFGGSQIPFWHRCLSERCQMHVKLDVSSMSCMDIGGRCRWAQGFFFWCHVSLNIAPPHRSSTAPLGHSEWLFPYPTLRAPPVKKIPNKIK